MYIPAPTLLLKGAKGLRVNPAFQFEGGSIGNRCATAGEQPTHLCCASLLV